MEKRTNIYTHIQQDDVVTTTVCFYHFKGLNKKEQRKILSIKVTVKYDSMTDRQPLVVTYSQIIHETAHSLTLRYTFCRINFSCAQQYEI